jgi:hypothetical protein
MNDERILDYLRSRARHDPPPGLVHAVMAEIDVAAQPRAWFSPLQPTAASLVMAVVVVAALVLLNQPPSSVGPSPSLSGSAGLSPSANPSSPFPIAAEDPRFAECDGRRFEDMVIAAFAFVAADHQLHFPNMRRTIELADEVPAFAVVFAEGFRPPFMQRGNGSGSSAPLSGHAMCVYVGQPPTGSTVFYVGVDITGMAVEVESTPPVTMPSPRSSTPPRYVGVEGLPITVLANDDADELFGEVQTCTSTAGYSVTFPASWYTNAAAGDDPACSWFAPEPFDGAIRPVAVGPPPPEGVWLGLRVVEGSAGYTTITPIYMNDSVSIGGRDGHRAEFGPSTLDEIESRPNYRAYWYVIPLGDSTFIAETNVDRTDDYPLAKAVLDRIVASVAFQN